MKLIFFLVAFFLVSIRVFFSWSGKDKEKRGISESSMLIKSDNFREELKYSGRFTITEDECGFQSISPGGYLKFSRNDQTLRAESNLQGKIEYHLNEGSTILNPDDVKGKKLISDVVHEMIYWGFDAESRMERLYKKGGAAELLNQFDSLKTDQTRMLYLSRLLAIDSLLPRYPAAIILKIGSLGSDRDKAMFLSKISLTQLANPQIAEPFFNVLSGIGSDMDKVSAIRHFIAEDSMTDENAIRLLEITGSLSSDMDRKNLFYQMIDSGLIFGPRYDTLLLKISRIGSDMEKKDLYEKLKNQKNLTESQWIQLIVQVSQLQSDMDKANLLVAIAQKMPGSGPVKEAYLVSARSIHNDLDYGRAIRSVN